MEGNRDEGNEWKLTELKGSEWKVTEMKGSERNVTEMKEVNGR